MKKCYGGYQSCMASRYVGSKVWFGITAEFYPAEQPSDEANCMASISYDLFVHVGVSPSRTCVCLERRARRFGYEREDFHGENAPSEIHPGSGKLSCGFLGPDWGFDNRGELGTNVDIERIASVVNSAGLAEVNVSNDAGAFYLPLSLSLCDLSVLSLRFIPL